MPAPRMQTSNEGAMKGIVGGCAPSRPGAQWRCKFPPHFSGVHGVSFNPDGHLSGHIARLFVYPVKSCAGIAVQQALLTETGLDLDRAWMVVDAHGMFVTQRDLPRMALIRPQLRSDDMVLRAPGMLALHVALDAVEAPATVTLWQDRVPAWDMGAVAAQWFSDFLGQPCRLVRFDPEHRRLSSMQWTDGWEAPNQFSDGFPLLLLGEASVEEFNGRLLAAGHAAVGIERFRPNLVLAGRGGRGGHRAFRAEPRAGGHGRARRRPDGHAAGRRRRPGRVALAAGQTLRPLRHPCYRPGHGTDQPVGGRHAAQLPSGPALGRRHQFRHERHRAPGRGADAACRAARGGRLALRLKLPTRCKGGQTEARGSRPGRPRRICGPSPESEKAPP